MDGGDGGAGRCMEGRRGVDSDINRILSKYRPIAPKPVVGGSGLSSSGSSLLSGKRTKRKYVRVSSGRCKNKVVKDKEEEKSIVTLQLLPERVDPADGIAQSEERYGYVQNSDLRALERNNNNKNINNNNFDGDCSSNSVCDEVSGAVFRGIVSNRVVESRVVVESVSNNSYGNDDRYPVIWNDNFVRQQLEGDNYPGFISKAESGRVQWVNEAYRRMVGCGINGGNHTLLMIVWLEIKEEAAEVISRVRNGFSCWVKVQYNNNNEDDAGKSGVSMALPCDAWRVESGGFSWRLDARAALCLGNSVDARFRPS